MTDTSKPVTASLVNFKWEMSVGQVFQLIGVVIACGSVYWSADKRLTQVESDVNKLASAIVKIESGITTAISKIENNVIDTTKSTGAALERFETRANSRMDVLSGTLSAIHNETTANKTNFEAFLRYYADGMRKRPPE